MVMDKESEIDAFQISLRAARITSGYTVEEAARCVSISARALGRYERNPSGMSLSTAIKILGLYQLSVDNVHFGGESGYTKRRRIKAASTY